MTVKQFKYVFGPVGSRRLGRSLGVNNVPYKTCSYSCIYCQLGKTTNLVAKRRSFYNVEDIVNEVRRYIYEVGAKVDCVTFVPDGEPLLDERIGEEIRRIKGEVPEPVAVLTNASLLLLEEARLDLLEADIVSVKIDGLRTGTWRTVNRPHPDLSLDNVLAGVREFAKAFKGKLLTETMLIGNFNTDPEELKLVAEFVRKLDPLKSYIAVPTRPPAEPYALPPSQSRLVEAYIAFTKQLGEDRVELLNMPEPPSFRTYGDPELWLLNLVSVHPLRLRYAVNSLKNAVENPEALIKALKERGEIDIVRYMNEEFVVRAVPRRLSP